MSEDKNDPTPTLPLSGKGADDTSNKIPTKEKHATQISKQIKQGVGPSPCEGGGWEGVGPSNERIFNHAIKTPLRRALRKNPTEPERRLWNRIRNKQLSGIKFRRQQGIDRYIVDFYCAEYSLVVEIDGDSHFTDEGIIYDQVRDDFLQSLGFIVLRFTNLDVMENIDSVLVTILDQIEKLQKIFEREKHPTPTLPLSGEGVEIVSSEAQPATQIPKQIKKGVSSAPCEGGGWEGVNSNCQEKSLVNHASLTWDFEGQPISSEFGDVYFSKANGLEETRHVFLHHNQLAERFSALEDTQHFTIAETGFGSGLNFLAAWDLWLKTAPQSAQLHFVSVEKFPLYKSDLDRALALWPEMKYLADKLIETYPVFVGTNFHRLKFMDGRVNLTLIIDDATAGFSKLLTSTHPLFKNFGIKVDAWFLDGFAPSKNPEMWSDNLFECIKCLSNKGTTAATFSAAAIVKNGLKAAGFSIQKVAGFGRKREMIKATFTAELERLNAEDFNYRGSFSPYPIPWTINQHKKQFTQKHALIIGGGLAGCHTARALAERGWQVNILERHSALAQEGSGNPQGVLYAKLSPLEEAQAAFNLLSFQYALHFYRPLWEKIGEKCGVLQLAYKESERQLQEQLKSRFSQADALVKFVTTQQAIELAGSRLLNSGLFFPDAGWIDPRKLCAHLVDHPNIQTEYSFDVNRIEYADNVWKVFTEHDQIETSEILIIASARDALNFEQAAHLPIKSIRGQTTFFPQTKTTPALKIVVCAEGYIAPAQDGVFCTGATFNLKDNDNELRLGDHQTNFKNLTTHLPEFENSNNLSNLQGRVAFRCSLPDYLPCVGPLPIVEKLVEDFAPLRKNARAGITTAGSYWPGLYINIGHGARGLSYAPLSAELLAAQINDEPLPMPQELANALNPARFVIRDLTRNKR